MLKNKLNPDELFTALLISPQLRWLRHVLLVASVLVLGASNIYMEYGTNKWGWQVLTAVMILVPIFMNVYLLVPRLLLKDRPYTYLLISVLTIVSVLSTSTLLQYHTANVMSEVIENDFGSISNYVILNNLSTAVSFLMIFAGTTAIIIIQLWLRDRQRITELEKASAVTELEMLKNQINPHFLFNMLNNAIVLAKEDGPAAREVILKLKGMLDYQLDRGKSDSIMLKDDINFLNDLLHLEKVRRDNFNYCIAVDGETEGLTVPPLLFIPFVENAVKHGNDNTGESYILIIFKIEKDRLTFFCTNSVPSYGSAKEKGGIGLHNIRRRLELIYGRNHILDISGTHATYNVNLTIAL